MYYGVTERQETVRENNLWPLPGKAVVPSVPLSSGGVTPHLRHSAQHHRDYLTGQVNGMFAGDETLAGENPVQGTGPGEHPPSQRPSRHRRWLSGAVP